MKSLHELLADADTILDELRRMEISEREAKAKI